MKIRHKTFSNSHITPGVTIEFAITIPPEAQRLAALNSSHRNDLGSHPTGLKSHSKSEVNSAHLFPAEESWRLQKK